MDEKKIDDERKFDGIANFPVDDDIEGLLDAHFEKFNISKVKSAHMQWKSRLEGLLKNEQELSPDNIPDHTQCEFGQWLATQEAQALASHGSFPYMKHHHEEVHDYAVKIAQCYKDGQKEKAGDLMREFEKVREKLFETLDELYTS